MDLSIRDPVPLNFPIVRLKLIPSFKIETQTSKKANSEQGKERRGKHGPEEEKKTVESA